MVTISMVMSWNFMSGCYTTSCFLRRVYTCICLSIRWRMWICCLLEHSAATTSIVVLLEVFTWVVVLIYVRAKG